MPRLNPPGWLKRALLPAWNEGHRLGRRLGKIVAATARGRWARCTCCGSTAPMLHDRRVIPGRLVELWEISPRLADAFARKESLACARCGAKLRARRLAAALLDLYPAGTPPSPMGDVSRWARSPEARALRVAELNRIDGLHEALLPLPGLCPTDFRDEAPRGALVDGVRNEDLTALTFDDNSFDVVLTSETLEHVPDLPLALSEIARVLVPGGRHLFTVPVLPGTAATFARSVLEADGTVRHLAAPICHPGGDSGYPVFTEFGLDLPEILRRAGFEAETRYGPTTEDDVTQVYIGRKP